MNALLNFISGGSSRDYHYISAEQSAHEALMSELITVQCATGGLPTFSALAPHVTHKNVR